MAGGRGRVDANAVVGGRTCSYAERLVMWMVRGLYVVALVGEVTGSSAETRLMCRDLSDVSVWRVKVGRVWGKMTRVFVWMRIDGQRMLNQF